MVYSVYANGTFETDENLDDLADALTTVMTSRTRPMPKHFTVGISVVSDKAAEKPGCFDETWHDENTLFKVLDAIEEYGYTRDSAMGIIQGLQNAGILFRERVPD